MLTRQKHIVVTGYRCTLLVLFFSCFCHPWPNKTMADSHSHTWQQVFQVLGFHPTITRDPLSPLVNATPFFDPTHEPEQVTLSRDICTSKGEFFIRLYIPAIPPTKSKLPLIVYLHGGGFVSDSVNSSPYHDHCNNMAAEVGAVVASVVYRLAPENPLPAAYEDALDAILWLKSQALLDQIISTRRDPWLVEFADFSRVFLMGFSSGANIAYHTALQATDSIDIRPLILQGVILDQPFFGGVERTSSELRLIDDEYVPLYLADAKWSMALPFQADRDHEFCNPFTRGLDGVQRVPRWFVKDDEGDPMIDRAKMFVDILKSKDVPVDFRFNPGGCHSIALRNATAAKQLFRDVKNFIYSSGIAEDQVSYAW